MFEDSGLAFGSDQLSEGSGFIDVLCVGQVLCTVLKEGIPDLLSILLDLSEKCVGFLYLCFSLDDCPCAVHERCVCASIEEVRKVPFGGNYSAASIGEEWRPRMTLSTFALDFSGEKYFCYSYINLV